MNLKRQAAVEVLKMLAVSSIGVAIAITIISTVPLNILGPVAALALLGVCVYQLYKIKLSDLEYKQKLNEMANKSSK
jgi:hypothetical protein